MTNRREWTDQITENWRKGFESVIATGQSLIDAKEALPHGEFISMIEADLPFKRHTAFRLMKIAGDERLTNVAHVQHFPPSWGTVYELTKLPDDVFEAKIADGSINPEMKRKDVARENRIITKARDEERVQALVPAKGKHKTLIIDPPWDYEWLSLAGRAAPVMSWAAIGADATMNASARSIRWIIGAASRRTSGTNRCFRYINVRTVNALLRREPCLQHPLPPLQ